MPPLRPDRRGPAERTFATGLAFALSAYLLWGLLPAYFAVLAPAGPYEIVAIRVVLSVVFCAILLTATRGWRRYGALWRGGRVTAWLGLAALLVGLNWTIYIVVVSIGDVVQAALGFYMNPLVTILLGVVFLRERLRPLQWIAIGVSAVAIAVLTLGLGGFPWFAIVLAVSFGVYGLAKHRVGERVNAVSGLAFETGVLLPFAIVVIVLIALRVPVLDPTGVGIVTGTVNGWHTLAMSLAGVLTTMPLLFFAGAARRLPLSYIGLTQYLAPTLTFIVGVVVLGEAMPPQRWIGFGIVWLAILLLIVDSVVMVARGRRATPPAPIE